MKRSIVKKYFIVTGIIIVTSFAFLGIILLGFISSFWISEKYTLLKSGALSISESYKNMSKSQDSRNEFLFSVRQVSDVTKTSLVFAFVDGTIYLRNEDILLEIDGEVEEPVSDEESLFTGTAEIPQDMINTILQNGGYEGLGTLDGVYKSPQYMVGVPLTDSDGSVSAIMFIAAQAKELNSYILEIFRIFLLSSIMVLIFTFVAVYSFSKRMTRPLAEMAEDSRRIANGDFSHMIVVDRDDEIGELALAFNNMKLSLSSLEQLRRSFIANVSHELRTPMTTIGGFIDGILDGTIDDEHRDYYLGIVSEEIKRLSRVVTSMMNLAKLEAGETKIKPKDFDLSELITRTILVFEHRVEDKSLEIRGLDGLEQVHVVADIDMIHQVVYNLIDNAVKFTPPQGYIEFGIKEDDKEVEVSIKNSGQGIPARQLPNIFERFYKADRSRGMDKNGTGLGLYIVKTIIDLHGGHITAESIEGVYTEFKFNLPKNVQEYNGKDKGKG